MKTTIKKLNKLLTKKVFIMLFFLITSFLFIKPVFAANFNYSDFDFDEFAKKNKGYWTNECIDAENYSDDCAEVIISKQKQYYTRLYKILSKYQKKGLVIDDNIIITTTFFGLYTDLFSDEGENYNELFGLDNNAYNYDLNDDLNNYDVDEIPSIDILENETETLDLLIKNMFGYTASCYAVHGDVTEIENAAGDLVSSCLNGGRIENVNGKNKCAVKVSTNELGFWEFVAMKFNVSKVFGIKIDEKLQCNDKDNLYNNAEMVYVPGKKKEILINKYWEFLESSRYFDKKAHLSSYFATVLEKSGHKSMNDLSDSEYDQYEEEILAIRKNIIVFIKSILDAHGSKTTVNSLSNVNNSQYWWPVGGPETTNSGTTIFSVGEPVTVNVTSIFGPRIHPVTKKQNSFHYGIDISGGGSEGTINVVAARDGIVESVGDDCQSPEDSTCGGYGNVVVISHGDGNYTLYAHLYEGSITVKQNESVSQGQVIGKIGNTGTSTGPHLHFEVRVGSNDASSAVDPLNYISAVEPRQSSVSSSSLMDMLICMEGKGPDDGGSNYKVYDDSGKGTGTLTVGPGITLINNVERFKRGINTKDYMYSGALIPKSVVDDIKSEVISGLYDSINTKMNNEAITLLPYQIDSLVSRQYNVGNINNFSTVFKQYGNTQGLYDNYMNKPLTGKGIVGPVLKSRRDREWNLFHSGIYFTCEG